MAFMDLTKRELVQAAQFYKVETDLDATKQNIANALLDAGITPEQWAEEGVAHVEGQEVADQRLEQQRANAEKNDAEAVEQDEEMVLVRFIGRNRSFRTGKFTFSSNQPFALMSREDYESLNRQKFREATKAEAAEFFA